MAVEHDKKKLNFTSNSIINLYFLTKKKIWLNHFFQVQKTYRMGIILKSKKKTCVRYMYVPKYLVHLI